MPEQSLIVQFLTATNLVAGFFTYVLIASVIALIRAPRVSGSIARVGHSAGWTTGLRNTLSGFTQSVSWVHNGYKKYNKNDKSYLLPGMVGGNAEIVIPRSQMQWMLDQPDSILSTSEAHSDSLHGDYSFIEPNVLKDPYHEHIIHKNLSRNLNSLIPEINDEVVWNMNRVLGNDTETWKSINVMDTFFDVVPRITNRMLVGPGLCRVPGYLDGCIGFTMNVVRNMLLLALTPRPLRVLVGPIASLSGKRNYRKTTKYTYPIIEKRLDDIRHKDASGDKTWQEPVDYITWHIRTAISEGRTDCLTVDRIAQCLMPLNFAAIHTTSLTGHGTLLDVLSTDPKLGILAALREEAERIYEEEGQQWTKAGLSRMYKIDSAIRESMRFSNFATTQSGRKVVTPAGITNPTEGWHAPYGTIISCPLYGAVNDPELYSGPETYDALRFSREREEYEAKSVEEKDSKEALRLRGLGMVTTSDKFFAFGHGRHACPGRFFVAHELKMIIAYMVMNYDMKYLDKRPQPRWIGRNMLPPTDARIELRRRVVDI